MGLRQSSPSSSSPLQSELDAEAAKASAAAETVQLGSIVLKHAVILQGLSGSGKTTVQSSLGLSSSRILSLDDRFLTTPQIYSRHRYRGQRPYDYGDAQENRDLWRSGGRGSRYPLWTTIAKRTQAVIFVVDSTDYARMVPNRNFKPKNLSPIKQVESRTEQAEILLELKRQMNAKNVLKTLLHELTFRFGSDGRPLLVLATKQDVEGAMGVEEICEALDMKSIKDRDWHVAGINAVSGEGLQEAVDWLNYVVEHPTEFPEDAKKTRKEIAEFEKIMSRPARTPARSRLSTKTAASIVPSKDVSPSTSINQHVVDFEDLKNLETLNQQSLELEQDGVAPLFPKSLVTPQVYPFSESVSVAHGLKRKFSEGNISIQQPETSAQEPSESHQKISVAESPLVEGAVHKKAKYSSTSSSSFHLPPRSEIPIVPQVLTRKHWFSREWVMKDDPNYGTNDIHRLRFWE